MSNLIACTSSSRHRDRDGARAALLGSCFSRWLWRSGTGRMWCARPGVRDVSLMPPAEHAGAGHTRGGGRSAHVEFSQADVEAAFGELVPLLEAYGGDLAEQPDTIRLFAAWAESAPVLLVSISWSDGNMAESRGDDYYTSDPDAVRRGVNRLVRGLERGFRRLATRKAS